MKIGTKQSVLSHGTGRKNSEKKLRSRFVLTSAGPPGSKLDRGPVINFFFYSSAFYCAANNSEHSQHTSGQADFIFYIRDLGIRAGHLRFFVNLLSNK